MIDAISNKVAKNTTPCFVLIAPLAMGRDLVRATSLSRSRSHKSLITQPAPRIIIAPIVKRAMTLNVLAVKPCMPLEARVMLHNPGSRRSQMPMGRSRRMRYA